MVMSQSMWTGPRVTRDFRCGGIAEFAHDYLCGQLYAWPSPVSHFSCSTDARHCYYFSASVDRTICNIAGKTFLNTEAPCYACICTGVSTTLRSCLCPQRPGTNAFQGKTMYFSSRFGIACLRFLLSSHLAEKSRSAYLYAPSQRTVTTV